MYETEVNRLSQSGAELPPDVTAALEQSRAAVVARTVLPWSEHCTECVWPTCYTTCDLYSAREDGRCRRFVEGMVRVECPEALNGYLLKITFKQWAKLWTPGNLALRPLDAALRAELRDYRIGQALVQLPAPAPVKGLLSRKRYSFKKKRAAGARPAATRPTAFLVECLNPAATVVRMTLIVRPTEPGKFRSFQRVLEMTPGFQRLRVSVEEIEKFVDLASPFNVELEPSDSDGQVTLIFGLMDFVAEPAVAKPVVKAAGNPTGKVKCVVWDLDHTLWDGILVEDGAESLHLKQGIREIVEKLDQRGILQSVASKNDPEPALTALRQLGIDEFFLAPQISWGPKSTAIAKIAQSLNIGADSILFVDDSEFERLEVSSAYPQVRTLDAADFAQLPRMEPLDVPVTAESRERRKLYQVENTRQEAAAGFGSDYFAFLRHCNIEMHIARLNNDNLPRVHELTQRTNQMNFSGTRYEREMLMAIMTDPMVDTYVLSVKDRFGSYGVVGFSIVDKNVPRMTDLMFSCRVQSKRVEHAFLTFLIKKYLELTGRDFEAVYRKTPRNAMSGKVFDDIGLHQVREADGVTLLAFSATGIVPDDGIVSIFVNEAG
jgi:FkbH-like protein